MRMMSNTLLANAIKDLRESIERHTHAAGRQAGVVELVAVSKTRTVQEIADAVDLGLTCFGENRVQEAQEKFPGLAGRGILSVRLIGHLQSNKVGKAVRLFDAIDSIDSLRLAGLVSQAALVAGKKIPVLLEINTSAEPQKSGFSLDADWNSIIPAMIGLQGLQLDGLMTVGPLSSDREKIRTCFAALRDLRDFLSRRFSLALPCLSMGMSDDYDIAIAEGSTMVRVGTALFGRRS